MGELSLRAAFRDLRRNGRTALARALCFMTFWIILLPSGEIADLGCGLVATLIATQLSLHLLPPSAGRLRLGALLLFAPHFLAQSVLAGIDVALRAFHPRLPLKPGMVVCRVGFPPGIARNEFAIITALLPGSIPVGETRDALIFHCLDVTQPIAAQIADEERRLTGALIVGGHDG